MSHIRGIRVYEMYSSQHFSSFNKKMAEHTMLGVPNVGRQHGISNEVSNQRLFVGMEGTVLDQRHQSPSSSVVSQYYEGNFPLLW